MKLLFILGTALISVALVEPGCVTPECNVLYNQPKFQNVVDKCVASLNKKDGSKRFSINRINTQEKYFVVDLNLGTLSGGSDGTTQEKTQKCRKLPLSLKGCNCYDFPATDSTDDGKCIGKFVFRDISGNPKNEDGCKKNG